MIATYRDPRYAASIRIEQLQERMPSATGEVPRELRLVHARRVGRAWAGRVAIGGFVAMVISALLLVPTNWSRMDDPIRPTYVLVAAIAASVLAYAVARAIAWFTFPSRVRASFDTATDELARLAHLESQDVREAAVRIAAQGEKAGLGLPLAGIALLGPLTIHFAVGMLGSGGTLSVSSFDWWICATLVLVGIAHVVLAVQGLRFADRVAAMSTFALSHERPRSPWAILGWTILASLFPGLLAIAIPPILVAVTGALFIPAVFNAMHSRALDERRALEGE